MNPPVSSPPLNAGDDAAADSELVRRAQGGDARAFDQLVTRYRGKVYGMCHHLVQNEQDAWDLAQEAFIKAWRALPSFKLDSSFYTWLYRIAVNTAKKFLLELKRDPTISENAFKTEGDDDETSWVRNEPIADETPETLLAAKEIAFAVNAAMTALPEDLRQALTLREIEGLSYEEISEMMNCPVGTVRSRIFRARETISAKVKPMLEKQTSKRW